MATAVIYHSFVIVYLHVKIMCEAVSVELATDDLWKRTVEGLPMPTHVIASEIYAYNKTRRCIINIIARIHASLDGLSCSYGQHAVVTKQLCHQRLRPREAQLRASGRTATRRRKAKQRHGQPQNT
jgi:hypothetical protein